jgi:hypothetical protein
MRCIRTAIVTIGVESTPDIGEDDVAEGMDITLHVVARIRRRLVTPNSEPLTWPDSLVAPLFAEGSIVLQSEQHVLKADSIAFRRWRQAEVECERIDTQWNDAMKRITVLIPRAELDKLIEDIVPEDDELYARFGQRVQAATALPENEVAMGRCRSLVERLGRWTETDPLTEAAERYCLLRTRSEEDRSAVIDSLRRTNRELERAALDAVTTATNDGLCRPDEQIGVLRDNLFVFDGQFTEEESQGMMIDAMAHIREQILSDAIQRDAIREDITSERPTDIPDRVRAAVWLRDGARCVGCGSVKNLEFDHVIPLSMGGASSVRNVVVMCSRCNERKSAQVAQCSRPAKNRNREGTALLFALDDPGTLPSQATR